MKLHFLGAAMMVTGSCYLLETATSKVLIDCGMFHGPKHVEALNRQQFVFQPGELSAVLLTHAHIDHSGLLPRLCKEGFAGTIWATKSTVELCKIMLPDSGHIQEFEAEQANRKGKRAGKTPIEPLYTVEQAEKILQQFRAVGYSETLPITSDISVIFHQAGHILGSAILEIVVEENGETTRLVFTGDLGASDQPIIKDPDYVREADCVVIESTYGNRLHAPEDKVERLCDIINDTVDRGGNIVIPSFAVGRTQNLLYYIYQLLRENKIPQMPVIIDSPLAVAATEVFYQNVQDYDPEAYELYCNNEMPFHFPGLTFTRTVQESKAINEMVGSKIIISASGMCDAGRILHHLKHNLWRSECTVLFIGYQAFGTLGRRLLDGVKKVKIVGEEISVKAHIETIDGFSAHADQKQLMAWLEGFTSKPRTLFVTHGEQDMSMPFAKLVEDTLAIKAYVPCIGDVAEVIGQQSTLTTAEHPSMLPEILQLRYMMERFGRLFGSYREKLEELVTKDKSQLAVIQRKLAKLEDVLEKTLKGL